MQGTVNYGRQDLMAVGGLNRGCVGIIKRDGKAKREKFVIADNAGALQCCQIDGKTKELKQVYTAKTANGKGFSTIDFVEEKVFAASGDSIRAFTKKGKEFFKVETNLTEPIRHMAVKPPFIWTAGDYVIACFDEGNEVAYLNSTDIVNSLILSKVTNDSVYEAVVGCQDRAIRVVHNKGFAVQEPCEGGVLTLEEVNWVVPSFQENYLSSKKKKLEEKKATRELLYGTVNGFVGAYKMTGTGLAKNWVAEGVSRGGVSAVAMCDDLQDGTPQVALGRDDGTVEILGFEVGHTAPVTKYKNSVAESVQSLSVGHVTTLDHPEILLSTYSGKIIVYAPEQQTPDVPFGGAAQTDSGGKVVHETAEQLGKKIAVQNEFKKKRLQALQEEVEKMKAKLAVKKEEYSKVSSESVAVTATHQVNDKWVLESNGSWSLTLEIDTPIDTVAIQSDVDIELLDTDSNACIVSTTVPPPDMQHSRLLACYRCTETASRIQVSVRTIEGQHGTLNTFIIPFMTPKTCQLSSYCIKPLSLHQRLNENPETNPKTVVQMRMEGNFTVNQMHAWIADCLPEVPSMLQEEKATFYFVSTFLGTILKVHYKANDAVFVSDNISALIILSEYVGKAATQMKVAVHGVTDTANLDEACTRFLTLLSPKLEYQLGLTDKMSMVEALKEIEMQESDVSFLSQEYRGILGNTAAIEKEHAQQPRQLDFLYKIVRKLFVDKHNLKGQNASHKMQQLDKHLRTNYNLNDLIDFFKSS